MNEGSVTFSGEETNVRDREAQLDVTLQEIRGLAEASSDELFGQNITALRRVAAVWKKGKVATISEDSELPIPHSSYQTVFPDDANDILIDYSTPNPYLMPNDAQ